MAEVTFYHQERVDGGRRTGVTVDGDSVAHGFVAGSEEYDPALVWYADVTVQSPSPPNRETALVRLQRHAADIRRALLETAGLLDTGIDANSMPAEFGQNGIRVTVSAMRRLVGRQISQKLTHFAEMDWSLLFPVLTPHG
jgi:hypothetical protein